MERRHQRLHGDPVRWQADDAPRAGQRIAARRGGRRQGKGAELTLRSLPAGRFIYLCDNFCGDEHDRMTGVLTVV